MRPRFAVLALPLAALAASLSPLAVKAAPRHNRGLTINVTPNPILAGDPVLIYGQLNNPPGTGQTIILYHHLAGSGRGYTRVSQTTTDGNGFYSFPRAEDVVMTNRSWFVREAGIHGVHSRTVFERVSALVSLSASRTTQDTGQPIVFTGHVTPNHAFERVALQEQNGSSDDWHTLKTGFVGPGSNYAISYRWRVGGNHDVRVVFPGDARNTKGASDPVTVTIQQKQIPGFTINGAPIVDEGDRTDITGTVSNLPDSQIELFARTPGQSAFVPVAFTPTDSHGGYTFTVSPTENQIYQVRTIKAPHRHSAVLFQGVRDAVTLEPTKSTATVGQEVTFSGTVLPDKAGHVIYLERLAKDGDYHVVETRFVTRASTFEFAWRFGSEGAKTFRVRITGDRFNVGDATAPFTVTVSPAPTSALPPAS